VLYFIESWTTARITAAMHSCKASIFTGILVLFSITIIIIWWRFQGDNILNPPTNAFNRNICRGHSRNLLNFKQLQETTEPQCFDHWISQDIPIVYDRFNHLLDVDQLWNSRTTNSLHSSETLQDLSGGVDDSKGACLTSFLSVGNSQIVHHIPHFAEAYFGYFSTVLWQHRLYRYKQDPIAHKGNTTIHPRISFSSNWNQTCIHSLLVGDHSNFWNAPLSSHTWMRNLVDIVDQHLGIQSIQSPKCIVQKTGRPLKFVQSNAREESWFLHPSDSLALTSMILKQSPCLYHNQAHHLTQTPIKIALVGRNGTRRVINEAETLKFLRSIHKIKIEGRNQAEIVREVAIDVITSWNSDQAVTLSVTEVTQNSSQVSQVPFQSFRSFSNSLSWGPKVQMNGNSSRAIYFEKMTFRQQVAFMHSVDIVITTHGAGETNIAFMKPCSVIIEVFPHGFYIPYYFKSLAEKVGLLHYSWQESFENTIRIQSYQEREHCQAIIHDLQNGKFHMKHPLPVGHIHQNATVGDPMDEDGNDPQLYACFKDSLCRSCVREADGMIIDHITLNTVLNQAANDRIKCMQEHPYYADHKSPHLYHTDSS
jgi:hypothetical protein